MKAALYCRVSTDEQAREGFSIPAQIKALTEYCNKNDINIYKSYIDEGQPGGKENRPQFQAMLKDAQKRDFEIILVHKFDRFARKVELSQRIKNQLRKTGINVVSITEPIEDSPIGFFQEGMLELLSEYYVKNLSQEVKKGQREKISQGKVCNMLPYGYRNISGDAIVIEDQADVVRKIYELYNDGYGTFHIYNYLNDIGVPTLKHGLWNTSQINYILRNETYIGALKWAGKIYKGVIPSIISSELFTLTQAKIGTKMKVNRATYYNKFLLLGLLKCGYCGSPMRISKMYSNGDKNNKAYFMYTCRRARYSKRLCSSSKHYQSNEIEKEFEEQIKEIISGVKVPVSIENKETNILESRKKGIDKELERVKKAYLSEVFSLEEYKIEKNRLEDELKLIEFNSTIEAQRKRTVKKIKSMWGEYTKTKTIQGKKALLSEVIKSINVFEDTIVVDFYG